MFFYFAQNKFIYFPTPPIAHDYKTITIENEDCLIEVIVLNSEKSIDKAIIYFGGNGESVVYSASDFHREFKNSVVYLINYRGYGNSNGQPSEKANYSDALKVFDLVQKKYTNITVIGRSLGSGVATYVASKRNISKLVLITPYDSIENLAQSKFFIYPMSLLLNQKYVSIGHVKDIKAKCLVLIAENDEVIPFKNSKNLVNEFPDNQINSLIIKNSSHNTISNSSNYFELLKNFIN